MMGKIEPKVTVCVMTYNQENYIRQCLQSIVDQDTDFSFEVIVSDDCSTDNTPKIIQEFAEQYPSIVKPIFHKKNLGPYRNYIYLHQQATGEYVANVDGDDFTYQGKLAAQVDILTNNEAISICGHLVDRVNKDGDLIFASHQFHSIRFTEFTLEDAIVKGALFAHSSYMYKRSAASFDSFLNKEIVDYYTLTDIMLAGDAVCINSALGAYRVHSECSSLNSEHKISLFYLDAYVNILDKAPKHGPLLLDAAIVNSLSIIRHKKVIPRQLVEILWRVRCLPSIKRIREIRKDRKQYHKQIVASFNTISVIK